MFHFCPKQYLILLQCYAWLAGSDQISNVNHKAEVTLEQHIKQWQQFTQWVAIFKVKQSGCNLPTLIKIIQGSVHIFKKITTKFALVDFSGFSNAFCESHILWQLLSLIYLVLLEWKGLFSKRQKSVKGTAFNSYPYFTSPK